MSKEYMIGDAIAKLRKEKGWTQQDLANKIHITDKAISRWESNRGDPSIEFLPILAEIFGVTIDYLLTGKEQEEKIIPMSRIELCTKNTDIKMLEELSKDQLTAKDEYGNDIIDYIIKYNNKKILTNLLKRVSISNIKGDQLRVIFLLLQFDMLEHLEKEGLFTCMKVDRPLFGFECFNLYSSKMIVSLAKRNLSDKFWNKYFSAHIGNLENSKSDWYSSYTKILKELISNENKGAIKFLLKAIIDINEDNFKEYEKRKQDSRTTHTNARLVFSSPMGFDHSYQCYYYSIMKLDKKTLLSLLEFGFKEEIHTINEFYKKIGCEHLSQYEFDKLEILANVSLSEIERKKLLCIHNGIINIDELLQIKNYKIVKKLLEDYPICLYEKLAESLKKKDYKAAFKFALDYEFPEVAEKIQNSEYEDIKLEKKLSNNHPFYQNEMDNYKYFIEENTLKSDTNIPIIFTGIMGKEKNSILHSLSINIDSTNILKNFSKEYFKTELNKENTDMVIINLCVRLETILKYNYGYDGDFSELLNNYFNDKLSSQDPLKDKTIDLLNRLRIKRNNIVHSEKTNVEFNKDDILNCIDYICNLKLEED